MWRTVLAAAATNPPEKAPEVSSDLTGIILTALITAATAIAVALIQRNRKGDGPQATPPFVVPEQEWIEVRNRSILTAQALEHLDRLVQGHVRECDEDMDGFRENVANLKGQLGIS